MHFNPAVLQRSTAVARKLPNAHKRTATPAASHRYGSQHAAAEIYSYIAARDMFVADAERNVTDMTLNRAFLANELVENCLQSARSPYQVQCLAEAEAQTERTRCEAVKQRIGQLRACSSVAA
jgi:hypothetical protein